MRTLLVCRGPIAFEALEIHRHCRWQLPHVVVSSQEWIAEQRRTAPWIVDLPPDHVHYVQEYNEVEAILRIAKEQHIDAIYPGYGFLAESAAFAERVRQTGVRFIGPTPETLRTLGDKDMAISLAKHLGMSTIPGDDALVAFAKVHSQAEIAEETVTRTLALARHYPGYPIRLKHPAGGGGKGQRVLSARLLQAPGSREQILDALTKLWAEIGVSSSEANAKKGVLLEVNIPRPLHWEVQLLGDGDTVVHLAARDCSLQNHGFQKFIELALYPGAIAREINALHLEEAPGRIAMLRQRQAVLERICHEALRLGRAIHLSGVATVEFLIDEQGTAYFLEVNPRIQVEHAVTECITRVHGQPTSLVELQHRVAAGERLKFLQSDITFIGDAIEVRLNAWHEDLSPVQGGSIHTMRLDVPHELRTHVRVDAGGLLQRREPWLIPGYDANFALLVVSGNNRSETLTRMTSLLDTRLQIKGDSAFHTNLEPIVGLLTLMQALPTATEFRTDTSLLWMALTAVILAQKQEVLSLIPTFPRRPEPHDPDRYARLLRAMIERAFVHPSRLLTYYLRRLMTSDPPPLSSLEVLFALAEELEVEIFEEEQQSCVALHEATAALWSALSTSHERYTALVRAAVAGDLEQNADYEDLCASLQAESSGLGLQESTQFLRHLLGWLGAEIPAITALVKAITSTQLHAYMAVPRDNDLSLPRPAYLKDEAIVARLHHLLAARLRPVVLRDDILHSPMEATIFLRPEPKAPLFVQTGSEIRAGQPLALLEAMKMFTEVTSPVDGILVDILVEDGRGVKTGTPLFKIATRDISVETTDDTIQRIIDRSFQNYFDLLIPVLPNYRVGMSADLLHGFERVTDPDIKR